MLLAFESRRVPRTKSSFDRTSSRRYSSLDYDTNGYYDHQAERMIIDSEDIHRTHWSFIDSNFRTNDDDDGVFASNGHDNGTVSFDDDNDHSDEYGTLTFLSLFFSSINCFALMLLCSWTFDLF